MCKSCVRSVQTVSKSSGSAHIFYAASTGNPTSLGKSGRLYTIRTHLDAQCFSTINGRLQPLLSRPLSTSSTSPITRTIIYT